MAKSKDLRTEVGQLLIMGFDGAEMSPKLRTMISGLQPGGVILFRRNIEAAQQAFDLVQECRGLVEVPLFTCIDMEGGTVDRLRDLIAPAPSVAAVFATGRRKLFRKHGRILGEESRALGFNTDFAPVLDLRFEPSLKVLGSRTASDDPKLTIQYARELLKGLKDAGVLGCGKHFPGLGEANLDTHKELPSIEKRWKELWKQDLAPYRELRREMPFVMVAHAAYRDVTKDHIPASISKKWISEILRKKIGYKGLAISDDLEMGGVQKAVTIEDAAIQTIQAGADIFLVCHKEEIVWRAFEKVLTTAEKDRRFAARVNQCAARILAFKKKAKELRWKPKPPSQKTIDKLRRTLWEFSEEVRIDMAAPRNA
ncbi:MAG TPA: beta-N-acetylhexosaminidase [Terriglobales bacterium]|nr:beta-N-acetylhexosaminidase [Terriglobales bacterium]